MFIFLLHVSSFDTFSLKFWCYNFFLFLKSSTGHESTVTELSYNRSATFYSFIEKHENVPLFVNYIVLVILRSILHDTKEMCEHDISHLMRILHGTMDSKREKKKILKPPNNRYCLFSNKRHQFSCLLTILFQFVL